ncbi:uncharacterized protein [Hyperolius riggenbachi]|uniref:uncharacterized protein isoform X2 n=1 Tax=Hyperolius riggenbachi TaxID=752182 RepID=UPI0035A3581E
MTTGIPAFLFGMFLVYTFGLLSPENTDLVEAAGNSHPPGVGSSLKISDAEGDCITKTFKTSTMFLVRGGLLTCLYDQGLRSMTKDDTRTIYAALKEILNDSRCKVGSTLREADKLESRGVPVTEIATPLAEQLRVFLKKAGLSKYLMGKLCGLLNNALSPSCLPEILATDLLPIMVDMQVSGSKGNNQSVSNDLVPVLSKALKCILTPENPIQGDQKITGGLLTIVCKLLTKMDLNLALGLEIIGALLA